MIMDSFLLYFKCCFIEHKHNSLICQTPKLNTKMKEKTILRKQNVKQDRTTEYQE